MIYAIIMVPAIVGIVLCVLIFKITKKPTRQLPFDAPDSATVVCDDAPRHLEVVEEEVSEDVYEQDYAMSKAEREFWAALEEEKTRTLEEDMQRWSAEASPNYVAPSLEETLKTANDLQQQRLIGEYSNYHLIPRRQQELALKNVSRETAEILQAEEDMTMAIATMRMFAQVTPTTGSEFTVSLDQFRKACVLETDKLFDLLKDYPALAEVVAARHHGLAAANLEFIQNNATDSPEVQEEDPNPNRFSSRGRRNAAKGKHVKYYLDAAKYSSN